MKTALLNQTRGTTMDYHQIITLEPGKRGGSPCIRGLRITVYDVLEHLASGMSPAEIVEDFPELTEADIYACLGFLSVIICFRPIRESIGCAREKMDSSAMLMMMLIEPTTSAN
jgi:uncharacterized protein (DUF433 family)